MRRSIFIVLAIAATLGFLALALWQIERRTWKLDLIDRVEARIHAAPVPIPEARHWATLDARSEEYRRVSLRGTFLPDRNTLVQAVTARGAGFWLLAPVRTDQGIVLVNRGYVPSARPDGKRGWPAPGGPVTVTGLLRVSEPGGGFLRSNDPAADRWYSRDVAGIARARGLGTVAPFFVDAEATPAPDVYPLGGLTVVRFRNNHLVYALTWLGLAALSAFAVVLLLRPARTR